MYTVKNHSIVYFHPWDNSGNQSNYTGSFTDTKTSFLLSVDPLADEYPSHSPYNYTLNNPIMLVDPNGMNVDEWDKINRSDGSSELIWKNDNGGNTTQIVNQYWETSTGEQWDLGTATYQNWPNSDIAMADIVSGGKLNSGPWNPSWWSNASGRIDLSPVDPIDLVTGAFAAKWALGGAKATAGAAKQSTTLYRAVSKAELDDISINGLRNKPGAYETGKLFTTTLDDATMFGRNNYMFDKVPNTVVKVNVPNSAMKNAYSFPVDGMNAISIPANQLKYLKATPMNYSPL